MFEDEKTGENEAIVEISTGPKGTHNENIIHKYSSELIKRLLSILA